MATFNVAKKHPCSSSSPVGDRTSTSGGAQPEERKKPAPKEEIEVDAVEVNVNPPRISCTLCRRIYIHPFFRGLCLRCCKRGDFSRSPSAVDRYMAAEADALYVMFCSKRHYLALTDEVQQNRWKNNPYSKPSQLLNIASWCVPETEARAYESFIEKRLKYDGLVKKRDELRSKVEALLISPAHILITKRKQLLTDLLRAKQRIEFLTREASKTSLGIELQKETNRDRSEIVKYRAQSIDRLAPLTLFKPILGDLNSQLESLERTLSSLHIENKTEEKSILQVKRLRILELGALFGLSPVHIGLIDEEWSEALFSDLGKNSVSLKKIFGTIIHVLHLVASYLGISIPFHLEPNAFDNLHLKAAEPLTYQLHESRFWDLVNKVNFNLCFVFLEDGADPSFLRRPSGHKYNTLEVLAKAMNPKHNPALGTQMPSKAYLDPSFDIQALIDDSLDDYVLLNLPSSPSASLLRDALLE